jgi:UBX domain-containing protein 1/4
MEEMQLMMQLSELGFPPDRIQRAIKATNSESLEAALDFLQNEQQDGQQTYSEDDKSYVDDKPSSSKVAEKPVDNPQTIDLTGETQTPTKETSQPPPQGQPSIKSVDQLQEKLAEKRKLEKIKEEQEEKDRELQRRREGKEITGLQRQRDANERKKMLEEQRRQAEDEKRRKERVLAMIKEDRANQEARTAIIHDTPASEEEAEPQVIAKHSDNVRVMVRGLSGPLTMSLSNDCTLDDVIARIEEEFPDTMLKCRLLVSLPHREFSTEDCQKSLLDLGLSPSTILTLAPKRLN